MKVIAVVSSAALALWAATAFAQGGQPCRIYIAPQKFIDWESCVYFPRIVRDPSSTPTVTPNPTATPSFFRWTGPQVIQAFRDAGLEVGDVSIQTDRGLVPDVCTIYRFLLPSLGEDIGGRVFECYSPNDVALLFSYYASVCRNFPADWCPHYFARVNIFVQIAPDLSESKSRRYRDALFALP